MQVFIRLLCLFLCAASWACASPHHKRDGTYLPPQEREFSEKLSLRERKIFCGQFNAIQRETALRYARGRGQDVCLTPDEAVTKVMEETGMSLASKGKPEANEDRK